MSKKTHVARTSHGPSGIYAPTVATTFTEASAKEALIEAKGDLFIASQTLRITAIRLSRAIQVSPTLRTVVETYKEHGQSVSDERIRTAIEERLALYRVAGLDALHELATMPIDSNSAQNQVKLAAAARLAGSTDAGLSGGALEETLRELNKSYQETAPRLRVTRERLTIETVPQERVIGSTDAPE
jgi:hypothetical protein